MLQLKLLYVLASDAHVVIIAAHFPIFFNREIVIVITETVEIVTFVETGMVHLAMVAPHLISEVSSRKYFLPLCHT